MSGGELGDVSKADPDLPCEFAQDGQLCGRLATTLFERHAYCDEHAAQIVKDGATGLSIADWTSLMYEAVTEPFGETARLLEELTGQAGDVLVGEFLESERRRFGLGNQKPDVEGIDATTPNGGDGARTYLQAARMALEADAAALRAQAWPGGDTEPADQAAAHADAVAQIDPASRVDPHQLDALRAGESSLQREAADWRRMAEMVNDRWRADFERHAAEMERVANGVGALHGHFAERDREAER
jgi:hypothetical protein